MAQAGGWGRGGGGRGRGAGAPSAGGSESRGSKDKSDSVAHSKKLSHLLRHGAVKAGVDIGTDGYVRVGEILSLKSFRGSGMTEDIIRGLAESNDKQRFSLTERDGHLYIRANQGHSFPVPDLELTPVTLENAPPVVVHGTNRKAWESIRTQGLNAMTRQHVHFAIGLPGEDGVISGMRNSSNVHVYLNVKAALKDGLTLLRSSNSVILCPGVGDTKTVPPKYFQRVVDGRSGEVLLQNGKGEAGAAEGAAQGAATSGPPQAAGKGEPQGAPGAENADEEGPRDPRVPKLDKEMYRPNAGIVIFNKNGNVLAGIKIKPQGSRQLPQGGIEKGEGPREAAIREAWEEIGVEAEELTYVATFPPEPEDWLYYEWGRQVKKGYYGQKQKFVLLYWDGPILNTKFDNDKNPEFSAVEWLSIKKLSTICKVAKRASYQYISDPCQEIINEYVAEQRANANGL